MLYESIREHYGEAEPIFFSDLEQKGRSKSALNQQLKKLCDQGLLMKYDAGVYYIPKKTGRCVIIFYFKDKRFLYN